MDLERAGQFQQASETMAAAMVAAKQQHDRIIRNHAAACIQHVSCGVLRRAARRHESELAATAVSLRYLAATRLQAAARKLLALDCVRRLSTPMVRFGFSWGAVASGGREILHLRLAVTPPPPARAATAAAPLLPHIFEVGAAPAKPAAVATAAVRERAPEPASQGALAASPPSPCHAPILCAASSLLPQSQPQSQPLGGARPPPCLNPRAGGARGGGGGVLGRVGGPLPALVPVCATVKMGGKAGGKAAATAGSGLPESRGGVRYGGGGGGVRTGGARRPFERSLSGRHSSGSSSGGGGCSGSGSGGVTPPVALQVLRWPMREGLSGSVQQQQSASAMLRGSSAARLGAVGGSRSWFKSAMAPFKGASVFALQLRCGGAAWSVTHSYKELLVFDAQLRASAAPAALALAELPVARGPSVIRLGAVQSWLKELLDAIAAGRLVDGGGALHLLSRCAPFLQLHVPPIVKLQVRATPPYLRAQPCTALHSPTQPRTPPHSPLCAAARHAAGTRAWLARAAAVARGRRCQHRPTGCRARAACARPRVGIIGSGASATLARRTRGGPGLNVAPRAAYTVRRPQRAPAASMRDRTLRSEVISGISRRQVGWLHFRNRHECSRILLSGFPVVRAVSDPRPAHPVRSVGHGGGRPHGTFLSACDA